MTARWSRRCSFALLAAAALSSSGCGPWITTIPTYWDPVLSTRNRTDADEESPLEVLETLPKEEPAKKRPDVLVVDVPPDTPKECLAIYVVTAQNRLYAFKPQSNSFDLRGMLECPGAGWATPFSMAVARTGFARVVFNDGRLFRVKVDDASCQPTAFRRNQPPGFVLFGMGYAPDDNEAGETLYVAEITFRGPSKGLASIDTSTDQLNFIAPFSDNPGNALELTPTGDGPLYGYFLNRSGRGGTLVQIDTNTAEIVDATPLDVGDNSSSLAVAWWGGSFFVFTSIRGGTEVSRYDPSTGATRVVATIDQTIVGAGVSTCAPGPAKRVAKRTPKKPKRPNPGPLPRASKPAPPVPLERKLRRLPRR